MLQPKYRFLMNFMRFIFPQSHFTFKKAILKIIEMYFFSITLPHTKKSDQKSFEIRFSYWKVKEADVKQKRSYKNQNIGQAN